MWTRKELKEKAKKNLKKNYSKVVAVCFIIAILTSSYQSSTTLLKSYDETKETTNNVVNKIEKQDNSKILEELFQTNNDGASILNKKVDQVVGTIFSKDSYIFKGVYSVKKFFTDNVIQGIVLIIASLLSFLILIFFQNILLLGENKFFIKNSNEEDTPIKEMFSPFKNKGYIQSVITMLKQYIYLILWTFTIVMLPIKAYEYKMIPYIIANNPNMKSKDAFKLSKELMKGNKWNAFILDLSFIGWQLLIPLTLGLVGILYVNPYTKATDTELYLTLKDDYIKNKKDDYKLLIKKS